MMEKDQKINFITLWKLNDWGMYNRRNEALLHELSRRDVVESVLHVEHISLRGLIYRIKQRITTKDKSIRRVYGSHIKKGFSLKPIQANDGKKYYIYSVVNCYSGALSIFKRLSEIIKTIQYRAINKHFIKSKKNVVLVAYPPSKHLHHAIKSIKHNILIADFVDDVLERTDDPVRKKQIEDNYKRILPKCKWIFSTSPEMNHKYGEYAEKKIDFLPNGADINNYAVNVHNKLPNKIGRKIAGYVGMINKTMDVNLLEYTVSYYPKVDFVLIGCALSEQLRDINRMIGQYNNLYFLGEKSFNDIPSYIEQFNVLINIKKNDYTTAGGDSQKVYEYLATGKPVVTTPVPPANRFADLMYVAYDKYQFVEYLNRALEENNSGLRERRVKTALDNSWAKRADVILTKISKLL